MPGDKSSSFNPAIRLQAVFKALEENRDPKTTLRMMWVFALVGLEVELQQLDETALPQFMRRIAHVSNLVSKVATAVHEGGIEEDLFLMPWRGSANRLVNPASWHQTQEQVGSTIAEVAKILGYTAHELSKLPNEERRADEESLADALEAVEAAINAVLAAESLPPHVKDTLTKRLERVRETLEDYNFTGSEPLAAAFEGAVAQVYLHRVHLPLRQDNDLSSSLMQALNRVWDVLREVAVGLQLAEGAHSILKLLG